MVLTPSHSRSPSDVQARPPNQTDCVANTGTFNKCGIGCPLGWHATSYQTAGQCFLSSLGLDRNQTTCVPNVGSLITVCAFGCPSGYRMQSTSFTGQCVQSNSNPSLSPNTTVCIQL
jgi:hypothetical protein